MKHPSRLRWADVDPALHAFNDTIALVARRCLPAVPVRDGKAEGWERAVTDVLVDHYGEWARGWCWAHGEGTIGGGPVRAWCCAAHSYTTQAETALKCAQGLFDWRAWLTTLRKTFIELTPVDDSGLELVAPLLIALVVERTDAGDAWYAHMEQVLGWYLEHHGVAARVAQRTARDATKGRFESWTVPSEAEREAIGKAFAEPAARQVRIAPKRR